jgi:hypothetical protein
MEAGGESMCLHNIRVSVGRENKVVRHESQLVTIQSSAFMSVILVTGSYDHEIRFWEAWSGICSRTIARSGESGVSNTFS